MKCQDLATVSAIPAAEVAIAVNPTVTEELPSHRQSNEKQQE